MNRIARVVVIGGIIVVAGGALVLWRTLQPAELDVRTVTAERTTVTQDVTFTGNLAPLQTVAVGFESLGTIVSLHADEGDEVGAGDVLGTIDARLAELNLAEARAQRASAQAAARLSLATAQNAVTRTAAESARVLESKRQAVRNAHTEYKQAKEVRLETGRESGDDAAVTKTAYKTELAALSVYRAAQQSLEETTKTRAKTDQAARDGATEAQAAYAATFQAASGVPGLSVVEAREAASNVAVEKSQLFSPIDGVIIDRSAEVGEVLTAASTLFEIATTDRLEITAQVPETDAVRVTEGMKATITFDALPQTDMWEATVIETAPAADIIEGVPTYKVTLQLDDANDSRLRPGLTANIVVHAAERPNVVSIPRRAVIIRDSSEFVRVLHNDNQVEEVTVSTGLAGSDGSIEITSGINEGDNVVISTLE